MKLTKSMAAAGALALTLATGCEDKPAGSATASSGTSAKETAATPAPAKKEAKVTAKEFGTKVVDSACKLASECKNEEARALTEGTFIMVVAFSSREPNPALKAIDEKMKAEKRYLLNAEECKTVGSKAAEVFGLSTDVLPKLVSEKRVTFSEDKAAQCIAELQEPPSFCAEETKIDGEIKMSQLKALEKKYEAPMDAYAKACEEVIGGTKKEGEACEYDVECEGESSCKKDRSKDGKFCKPKKKS